MCPETASRGLTMLNCFKVRAVKPITFKLRTEIIWVMGSSAFKCTDSKRIGGSER